MSWARSTEREMHPEEDREHHGRAYVAALRVAVARDADDGESMELVELLRSESEEFASLS